MKYGAIMADPPWPQPMTGAVKRRREKERKRMLAYPIMSVEQISTLPIRSLANEDALVWLWTTNACLHSAFHVFEAWHVSYLNILTWSKPAGFGAYFATTTQHLLVGYYGQCHLKKKWEPTNYEWVPRGHSRKPDHAYRLVERVSFGPYLELFARERRFGWDSMGNEIDGRDIREALEVR